MSRKRSKRDENAPESGAAPDQEVPFEDQASDLPESQFAYEPETPDPDEDPEFRKQVLDQLEFMLHHIHKSRDHSQLMNTLRTRMCSAHALMHMDSYTMQYLGMNHLDAFFFGNFLSMCRGIETRGFGEHPRIARLSEARDYIAANFHHLEVERFYLFCVNHHGKLKIRFLLNQGTEDRALLSISQLMSYVLHEKPLGVIVAHNHPQQNPMPSREDIACTIRIIQALFPLRVPLLDHLVVTDEEVVSIRENGFIPEREWMMQVEKNFLLRDWFLPPLQPKPRKPKMRTPEEERKRVERELRYARSRRLRKMDKAMRMYRHHTKNANRCMAVYQQLSAKDERLQREEEQLRIHRKIELYLRKYARDYRLWMEEEALKKQSRKGKSRTAGQKSRSETNPQD